MSIITENIYGVDILSGAIEISKLRLWLWLISEFNESENEIKALPNIEYNLKVGNSLVGWLDEKLEQMSLISPLTDKIDGILIGLITNSDKEIEIKELKEVKGLLKKYELKCYIEAYSIIYKIYRGSHGRKAVNLKSILEIIRESIYSSVNPAFLDYINTKIKKKYDKNNPPIKKEEFDRLNVFHWKIDFGEIMKNGGFDIVIGNPPYVTYNLDILNTLICKNLSMSYNSKFIKEQNIKNSYNLAALFLERSFFLLRLSGEFAMIVPHSISRSAGYKYIRDFISKNTQIIELDDEGNPFKGVTLEMITIFYKKSNYKSVSEIKCFSKKYNKINYLPLNIINQSKYWILYYDDIYIKTITNSYQVLDGVRGISFNDIISAGSYFYLSGKNIKRYYLDYLAYKNSNKINVNPYLANKKLLVITQFGTKYPRGTIIDTSKNVPSSGCVIIKFDDKLYNINYILGIINSQLISFFFSRYVLNSANLTIHLDGIYLKEIPIKDISQDAQKPFIKLVDQILSITKDEDYLQNSDKKAKVKKLENEIDQLVYKLYDLTPDEIKIVEDSLEK